MARIEHRTLVADTVTDIAVTGSGRTIRVLADSDDVYFTIDGSTPTVQGDDVPRCLAGGFREEPRPAMSGETTVRVISAGTPDVSVEVED